MMFPPHSDVNMGSTVKLSLEIIGLGLLVGVFAEHLVGMR